MKILLQSLSSGKFCADATHWTNFKDEARDFLTSDDAIAFAQQHQLREVQVVLQFHDHSYHIHLPRSFVLAEAAA